VRTIEPVINEATVQHPHTYKFCESKMEFPLQNAIQEPAAG